MYIYSCTYIYLNAGSSGSNEAGGSIYIFALGVADGYDANTQVWVSLNVLCRFRHKYTYIYICTSIYIIPFHSFSRWVL